MVIVILKVDLLINDNFWGKISAQTSLIWEAWDRALPKKCPLLATSHYYMYNWASKASPTLGCSIEISRNIYMLVGMSVVSKMRRRNYLAHAHAQSHFWAVKTDL